MLAKNPSHVGPAKRLEFLMCHLQATPKLDTGLNLMAFVMKLDAILHMQMDLEIWMSVQ